jgi:hypothetical protein
MELVISIFVCVVVSVFIGIQWVNAIDYMSTKYPEYKGEDLFDEDLTPRPKKPTKKNEKNKGTD